MKAQTFDVTYTTRKGTEKHLLVKATSEKAALKQAAYLCYTGKDFRNAILTDQKYSTPRENGFQGSERSNK